MQREDEPAERPGPSLLVRPPRAPGESAIGHWLRQAERNGLRPAWLPLPDAVAWHARLRCCALCLASPAAIWQQAWLDDAPWCGVHRVWLLDACSACGLPVRPLKASLHSCACKAAWASTPTQAVPAAVLAAADAGTPLSVMRWIGALDRYGLQDRPLRRAARQGMVEQQDLITRGAVIARSWPAGFCELLDRLAGERRAAGLLNAVWPGLLARARALSDAEWRTRVLDTIADHVAASRSTPAPVLGRNAPPYPSKHQVARRLGIGFDRLNRLVNTDTGDEAAPAQRGRLRRLVLPEDEVRVREALKAGNSVKAAGKVLGFSAARVRQLLDQGQLQAFSSGVARGSVDTLVSGLMGAVGAKTGPWVDLGTALRHDVPVQHTAEFVEALLKKQVHLHRPASATRLADLLVDRASLHRWWAGLQTRSVASAALTLDRVAQRLGIKDEVVSHLLRIGLLHAELRPVGRRRCRVVTESEMQAFEAKYTTLAAVAREAGVGARGALAWAKAQRLHLATGPGVDGSRQYFIDRAPRKPRRPSKP